MTNIIKVRVNGPLIITGNIRIEDSAGNPVAEDTEAYLCRCGLSANKPFCDGSHKGQFSDAAVFTDNKAEVPQEAGSLTITLKPNAMLIAKGPMLIHSEDGTSQTTRNKAALCRCGHSDNKPFCDVSHKHCGFSAD